MNKLILAVRRYFERKLMKSLHVLKKSFFVVDQNQQQEMQFQSYKLELTGYLWGIIPRFGLKKGKSISLSHMTSQIVRVFSKTLSDELSQVPSIVLQDGEGTLKRSLRTRIGKTKANIAKLAMEAFKEINQKSFESFVKTDRNKFRQQLLEKLGTVAAEVFIQESKTRIAELVLRIREELQEDGMEQSTQGQESESFAFPIGTRFSISKGRMRVFVIEQSPAKRTIQVMEAAGDRSKKFELSYPYVIFFVVMRNKQFDSLYVTFRKEPLHKIDDELLCPAFANIHDDFQVCFTGPRTSETLAETAESAIANFWGGRFKLSDISEYLTSQIDLEEWRSRSSRDALFGLSFAWRRSNKTVKSLIAGIEEDFKVETRRRRNSRLSLSSLQKSVEKMEVEISRKMQEAVFQLVSDWKVDKDIQDQIGIAYMDKVRILCLQVQKELEQDIEQSFSDNNLQSCFDRVTARMTKTVEEGGEAAKKKAFNALLVAINEENNL